MTQSVPTNYRVFLSHGTSDTYIGKRLKKDLERSGATVFIDTGSVEFGDDFRKILLGELANCDELLVLITKSSLSRPWVLAEIGATLIRNKRIVVVRYGPSQSELQESGLLSLLGTTGLVELDDIEIEAYIEQLQKEWSNIVVPNFLLLHSPFDKDAAESIAKLIRQAKWTVMFDSNALVTTRGLTDKSLEAFDNCDVIVVLLSVNLKRRKTPIDSQLVSKFNSLSMHKIHKEVVSVLLDSEARENWVWPIVSDTKVIDLAKNAPETQFDFLFKTLEEIYLNSHPKNIVGNSQSRITRNYKSVPPPSSRKLRGYAIDPSLSSAFLTSHVNQLTYEVDWENLVSRDAVTKATYPIGEYLEIVDYDPSTGVFYEPVNLDDPYLLAQNGYAPSVNNPQFHQQFVYAVMMTTIKNFEKALGRKIIWAENIPTNRTSSPVKGSRSELVFSFVRRLRVYPHALRQANAFYDPNRKAMLFGYFNARPVNAQLELPGETVFTCLSHDIIAHETTHAILDGIHRRYTEPTHPDTRAFHEAFADIVALFQHFSFPEVVRHQIAQTRGNLRQQNLLAQLAQQFGKAVGSYGSLRDAIGRFDADGNWSQHKPDPTLYTTEMECHARGSILVAAVFDAFVSIYQTRARKIMRIATGGSGILPDGDLHPDLVDELANAAAKSASDVLRICIRALDYCPPMDVTFGDYLRAIVTADFDMLADDSLGYRVAFVEAFQKWGIGVPGIRSMAVEDLLYPIFPSPMGIEEEKQFGESLRSLKDMVSYLTDREGIYNKTKELIRGESGIYRMLIDKFINGPYREAFCELTGLLFPGNKEATEKLGLEHGYLTKNTASFAISNISLANRVTPQGTIANHVVITIVQKRGVRFNVKDSEITVDEKGYFVPDRTPEEERSKDGQLHTIFRGGCSLIFDLDQLRLRYVVKKDINDLDRMVRQVEFEQGLLGDQNETYFSSQTMNALAGPFAFAHSHHHPH